MIGRSLGPYKLFQSLGAGGMGEVYLAEDTRLGRQVAIKVLPEEFAANPERVARFEQEARATAALNHPHIAAVFDVGASDGTHFIVEEYLSGQTLRQLLGGRPLVPRLALALTTEIVEGLTAAHREGIVHRDLKPENVFVTKEGHAKILDFGLAKLVAPIDSSVRHPSDSASPTRLASPLATSDGQLLGSAGYMSPEQAEGRPVDQRTDVFGCGCILYEMITGRRAFAGRSVHEILSKIVHDEPPPIGELAPEAPPQIQWVLDKCLAKDPEERYQHANELLVRLKHLRRELEAPARLRRGTASKRVSIRRRRRQLGLAAGLLAALLIGLVLGLDIALLRDRPRTANPSIRFTLPLPAGEPLALGAQPPVALAIAPDGSEIVYVVNRAGKTVLYRRRLSELAEQPIAGTENGHGPFFSPDGRWLGFWADGKLKVMSLPGGAPTPIVDASISRGAAFTFDGRVVFCPAINSGLWIVPAAGGEAKPLTTIDGQAGEYSHRWPQVLPGGEHVIFTIDTGGSFDEARIGLFTFGSGARRDLLEGASCARYVESGYLVFGRQGNLYAAAFSPPFSRAPGLPRLVMAGVTTQQDTGIAHFDVSTTGTLVYAPGGEKTNERTLVLVREDGSSTPLPGLPERVYQQPSLSPDGTRLAVNIVESTHDLWIADIARGGLSRLTFEGDNHAPVWTPDGRRIAFASERGAASSLYWIEADGSGKEELLYSGGGTASVPTSFSADGKRLLFTTIHPGTRSDVWILSVEGEPTAKATATPFLEAPYEEREAAFSPAGSSILYTSNETGRYEVYVQPYPGPGRKLQISTDGGDQPLFSRNGKRIFFRNGDDMLAVEMTLSPSLSASSPRLLFSARFEEGYVYQPRVYDVSTDGRSFVVARTREGSVPDHLEVVVGWLDELEGAE